MPKIELSARELDSYKAAVGEDESIRDESVMPYNCIAWGYRTLKSRGLDAHPDRVTVQLNHQTGFHIYDLHYKI